jgi:hypothetical protein
MRRTYIYRSATVFAVIVPIQGIPGGLPRLQRSSAAHCRHFLPEPANVAGLLACSRCSLGSLLTLFAAKRLYEIYPTIAVVTAQDVMRSEPSPRFNLTPRPWPSISAIASSFKMRNTPITTKQNLWSILSGGAHKHLQQVEVLCCSGMVSTGVGDSVKEDP